MGGTVSLGFPPVGAGPKSPVGNQVYSQAAFGGAWTFPDKSAVPAPFGILCQDCRFQAGGGVGTRYAWGQAFQLNGENANNTGYSAFNWLSELGNYLVWLQSNTGGGATRGLRILKLSDSTLVPMLASAIGFNAFSICYAPAGPRLYYSGWTTDGLQNVIASSNANVISQASGSVTSAAASASPTTITMSANENLVTGDLITFFGATGNWTPLNATFTWTTVSPTTGTIPLNSTGFGALTGTVTWIVWHSDAIIPGPPSTAATGSGVQIPTTAPTEPSGGIVTAGLHNLGLRMQHRSGFLGRPGPDSSTTSNPTTTTFVPIAFTSSGSKNLQWAFTPTGTWPADVIQVQAVMSPISNPNRLFLVPGTVQTVVGGASTAVTFTINIDDATLIASAAQLECTNSLDWYTASATSQALMQVSAVAQIGNRMLYVSQQTDANGNPFSVIYASDPYNYQQITKDQHVIQLPGQLKITQAFGVQGSTYIGGPHWTFATQDNGQVPVNWPQPHTIDGRKGILFPNCVEVETSGRYAWIADKTGLYYFDGSYSDRPISDKQRDVWTTSEFGTQNFVVKDDPLGHRVFVQAILSSTSTIKLMMWDYTNGLTAETVNFSLQATPNSGTIEMVQNDLSGVSANVRKGKELWFIPQVLGVRGGFVSTATNANPALITLSNPQVLITGDQITFTGATGNWAPLNSTFTWTSVTASTGTITLDSTTFGSLTGTVQWTIPATKTIVNREMNALGGDTNPYRDIGPLGGVGIHAICEYMLPAGGSFNALSLSGAKIRVTGNKAFQPTVFTFDKTSSISLRPAVADLASQPDGRQNFFGYLVTQNGTVFHFEQNILDGNFLLSQVDMVYNQFGSLL